ncbi:MAG: BatA domain-containing protein, partial [Candidatus Latescibacteria bacterium]|nr:BatA domain-containing protein [Candidatus Latescibacterota bacterium]
MMFSFLNVSMLPALGASLLPLLIHLIHRRKVPHLPFSNVTLLMTLQGGRLRSFKTHQWLLLLLRTLAIFFLTLAFCRPIVGDDVSSAKESENGRKAILLLDRSYSLGYQTGERRLFDRMLE